ncbi:hypothetical protein Pdca_29170 [Pseudonocardia autotrophica]|nr:hypothetical protein Pdca_29170 [Pseudonocardia autotrophica]
MQPPHVAATGRRTYPERRPTGSASGRGLARLSIVRNACATEHTAHIRRIGRRRSGGACVIGIDDEVVGHACGVVRPFAGDILTGGRGSRTEALVQHVGRRGGGIF